MSVPPGQLGARTFEQVGLLDGFLNDAFFAFELIQHYSRRNDVGPFHPAMSVFTATNSSPYNIEALFQFIQVLWNSRGYTTAIATFRGQNGPFKYGRDIFVGMLMTLVYAVAHQALHRLRRTGQLPLDPIRP